MNILNKILRILEIIITTLISLAIAGMIALLSLNVFFMLFINYNSNVIFIMPLWLRIAIFVLCIFVWVISFIPIYVDELKKNNIRRND